MTSSNNLHFYRPPPPYVIVRHHDSTHLSEQKMTSSCPHPPPPPSNFIFNSDLTAGGRSDVSTRGNMIEQKIRVGKEEKEAAAQQKFRDKRKKALSDLLVNIPKLLSDLSQENCEVGGHN